MLISECPLPLPKRQTQDLEDYRPESQDLQQPPVVVTAARRRFFNQIITKCVLQLLMIETVQELFTNVAVYDKIPSGELLRLMAVLKKSYHFAKRFNADRDLRSRLFREGFMKQPPNLLKQESGSASVYVSILFRMYQRHIHRPSRLSRRHRSRADPALRGHHRLVRRARRRNAAAQHRHLAACRCHGARRLHGLPQGRVREEHRHLCAFACRPAGNRADNRCAEMRAGTGDARLRGQTRHGQSPAYGADWPQSQGQFL